MGFNQPEKQKIHFGTGNDCAEDYYYVNKGSSKLYWRRFRHTNDQYTQCFFAVLIGFIDVICFLDYECKVMLMP